MSSEKTKPGFLFVLDWPIAQPGGVNEAVRNLYRTLQENDDFEPSILQNEWEPQNCRVEASWNVIPFRLRNPWDNEKRLKTAASFVVWLPQSLSRLRALLRSLNTEAIDHQFPDLNSLHFVLLKKLRLYKGKLILTFQGSDTRLATQTVGAERILWKLLLAGADRVVTVSNDLAERIIGFSPDLSNKVITISNAVDRTTFLKEASTGSQLPSVLRGRRFILYVAVFEPRKAHDVMLAAYQKILSAHPDIALALVGRSGPASNPVRSEIEKYGLQEHVFMFEDRGHPDVAAWMMHSEMVVLASRFEGLPFALLEAGICGKPVVSTPVGGIPQLISDGVTGRLVPVDNPEALSNTVIELFNNPDELNRLGNALREKVAAQFTWQQVYERYVKICREDS